MSTCSDVFAAVEPEVAIGIFGGRGGGLDRPSKLPYGLVLLIGDGVVAAVEGESMAPEELDHMLFAKLALLLALLLALKGRTILSGLSGR